MEGSSRRAGCGSSSPRTPRASMRPERGATDPSGSADDTTQNGPFNAAIDVVPALNPLNTTIAVNRADGVTRALVAPSVGKNIFAGQGAVIDTGADMEPVTAARKFQFVELGDTGADKADRKSVVEGKRV